MQRKDTGMCMLHIASAGAKVGLLTEQGYQCSDPALLFNIQVWKALRGVIRHTPLAETSLSKRERKVHSVTLLKVTKNGLHAQHAPAALQNQPK